VIPFGGVDVIARDRKDRSKSGCLLASVSLVLIIVGVPSLGLWWLHSVHGARRDFEMLLAGDQTVSLVAVEIESRSGRRIAIRDHESLSYLSAMCRSARPWEGEFGGGHAVTLQLSTGRSVYACVYVLPRKDQITVFGPFGTDRDPVDYAISLREPVPRELDMVLDGLRSESAKATDRK
jgi:hypothetical protein